MKKMSIKLQDLAVNQAVKIAVFARESFKEDIWPGWRKYFSFILIILREDRYIAIVCLNMKMLFCNIGITIIKIKQMHNHLFLYDWNSYT